MLLLGSVSPVRLESGGFLEANHAGVQALDVVVAIVRRRRDHLSAGGTEDVAEPIAVGIHSLEAVCKVIARHVACMDKPRCDEVIDAWRRSVFRVESLIKRLDISQSVGYIITNSQPSIAVAENMDDGISTLILRTCLSAEQISSATIVSPSVRATAFAAASDRNSASAKVHDASRP
jgi:hypothetical protein